MQTYQWPCFKHHFLITFKKILERSLSDVYFLSNQIFHLDRGWRLKNTFFWILPEVQWNTEYEATHKIWNISFLDVCITPNQQNLSITVFSNRQIFLNPISCHPVHIIKIPKFTIPTSQFLRLLISCSNTSNYIKRTNKYLKLFIKQGYNSFKLKMLTKQTC